MRLRQLDVLRAVAVLLVMFRHLEEGRDNPGLVGLVAHMNTAPIDVGHAAELLGRLLYRVGWVGVDLFFVLSGFLVSGLLFREHQKHRKIRPGRFLIRRGLKIYPLFYLFLLSTVLAIVFFTDRTFARGSILCEALFVQNYGPNVWGHTWSLAIEEHFYLLLVALLLGLSKWGQMARIPAIFLVVALGCLGARVLTTALIPAFDFKTHVFATHLRLDALFYGVVLSYAWHFERARLAFCERGLSRPFVLLGGLLLFTPALFLKQDHPVMRTVGLSCLSLGGVLVILWSMTGPPVESRALGRVANALAWMGAYSYSIYLWHVPVLVVAAPITANVLNRVLGRPLGTLGELTVYVVGSVVAGVVTARLVEFPVLVLRDRWFPGEVK